MVKFNRMFSSLLIATELVFVTYSYCSANMGDSLSETLPRSNWANVETARSAEAKVFYGLWQEDSNRQPPGPEENAGSTWRDVLPLEFQQQDDGNSGEDWENAGSRVRGGFCPIAPGRLGTTQVVWNDRPLFLWDETRGNVTRVQVRDGDDIQNSTLLWEAEPTENQAQYDGEALEPGQTYYWLVFFNGASDPTMAISFQIAEAADRDRIAGELAALTLPENASEEDIARIRAQYFTENGLPSDAFLEAFSVIEPSEELATLLETLPEEYCWAPED